MAYKTTMPTVILKIVPIAGAATLAKMKMIAGLIYKSRRFKVLRTDTRISFFYPILKLFNT